MKVIVITVSLTNNILITGRISIMISNEILEQEVFIKF